MTLKIGLWISSWWAGNPRQTTPKVDGLSHHYFQIKKDTLLPWLPNQKWHLITTTSKSKMTPLNIFRPSVTKCSVKNDTIAPYFGLHLSLICLIFLTQFLGCFLIFYLFLISKAKIEPLFIFYPCKMFWIFAPLTRSLPTSADAQAFKRWREKLHDSTLIYSRPLHVT